MRLLLVEDEPRVARFIAKGTREQGYAVDIAPDGEEALYKASITEYDLIILDVMMPRKNGFQVCKEMRAQGMRQPVLMLTARDGIDDRVTGLDCGADDYLGKPFDFKELLARIRALLRLGKEVRPETLQIARQGCLRSQDALPGCASRSFALIVRSTSGTRLLSLLGASLSEPADC